jgi:tetratricopeptide (TPR) repeat protein
MSPSSLLPIVSVACALLAAGIANDVHGASRGIHYGAAADSELAVCDDLRWRGQMAKSEDCYAQLLRGGTAPAVAAEAAWALGDLQQANQWFRQATGDAPDDASIRVRWGDLFAATHQDAEAMNIYREALSIDADNGFANLGAARLLAGGFDEEANIHLEKLLNNANIVAGARLGAWLLVARAALENGNQAEASAALSEAESLINQNDWPPLEVYALKAAADMLNNVDDSDWIAKSLEYNAYYGGIYATPAYFYVITRRYRDAIAHYQKALDIEPDLAAAHEELGVNLLRDNQMSRARAHLETAHDLDPFSPKAVNTLRLLDSFTDFTLISDPSEPGHDNIEPVTFRLHKEEAGVIAPYAIELTRNSIEEFTKRYDFELREPVIVEMYPDHEDFAVRTAGMPGIGILGATFGYVLAMDSPSSRPPEQYQWGTTLWHELAHVFTLEASNHLVPRWFSEGVSVFEEWRSGPSRGVRIPMNVYSAIKDDRLLPVAELDEGFIRPTYEEQIIVSYMQAGLICYFIDARYGADKLAALLYKFADGLLTADAIEAVLGMPASQFDDEFDNYVQTEHGTILNNLEDWHRSQKSIAEHVVAGEWQAVPELARHVITLLPQYVEPDSPYIALARAEQELGNHDAAIEALEGFWQRGGYDPSTLKKLATWLSEADRTGDAVAVLSTVNYVDPLDREVHGTLGDLLLANGRPADALREFTVALALDPHDKATAYYRMAQAYYELGNKESSQDHLLQALDVAPNFRPAQRLLLEVARSDPAN